MRELAGPLLTLGAKLGNPRIERSHESGVIPECVEPHGCRLTPGCRVAGELGPGTGPLQPAPQVTQGAAPLLDRVETARVRIESVEVAGKIRGEVDRLGGESLGLRTNAIERGIALRGARDRPECGRERGSR